MSNKYCFSRITEHGIALYPFQLSEVAPFLRGYFQIYSTSFLVEDMSVSKYFTEKEASGLNSIEDFLSFCAQLKEPFIQEFEVKCEDLNISVDDENYITLEFKNTPGLVVFLEELLSGLNLFTPELFNAVFNATEKHFICVSNEGVVSSCKDYSELMESFN
ncbi:MAG: hypothetical protein FD170_3964 [Bacteroidetes bacterium]|nr:MAG: hypothetical protein FD170_3964 [Bacteroidota bacterium]